MINRLIHVLVKLKWNAHLTVVFTRSLKRCWLYLGHWTFWQTWLVCGKRCRAADRQQVALSDSTERSDWGMRTSISKLIISFLSEPPLPQNVWPMAEMVIKYSTGPSPLSIYQYPCGSVVEHCVSSAKVVGSIPREHTYWQYKCIAWMHCKSLWIKVSDKCLNVNVKAHSHYKENGNYSIHTNAQ